MPTVEQNLEHWSHYGWSAGGDEWSRVWGGTPSLWWGTLYPRLRHFLPVGSLLEIAPGYGRLSRYLKDHANRVVLVDLTERCVEACRSRFRDVERLEAHVNDGRSLAMVRDGSVDLAFSFDSLVHVEPEIIEAYLRELSRKLTASGIGFFHHSNLGALRDPLTGALPYANEHWRSETMSAELFVDLCRAQGLRCVAQEIVDWGALGKRSDCLSVFTRPGSPFDRPFRRLENPDFMAEAVRQGQLRELYGGAPAAPSPAEAHASAG